MFNTEFLSRNKTSSCYTMNPQLTCKLVNFINIHNYVIDFNKCSQITIEFIVDKNVIVSYKDWIAIFPHNNVWNSFDINLIVTFEYVLCRPADENKKRYEIQLSLKGAKKFNYGQDYQFVYYNDSLSEIIGISESFKFFEDVPKNVLSNNITFHKDKLNKQLAYESSKENAKGGKCVFCKNFHSKILLQENEIEGIANKCVVFQDCNSNNRQNTQNLRNKIQHIEQFNRTNVLEPINESRLVSKCKTSKYTACYNCHEIKTLKYTLSELYTQVKNFAEMKSDLEKQVAGLQKEIELGHAANQKLSVMLMHERKWKIFCKTRHNHISNEKEEVDRGISFHTNKYRSSAPNIGLHSSLRLKSIIGSQENTIRLLTEKLAKLQSNEDKN